jgi:hypothetical protein
MKYRTLIIATFAAMCFLLASAPVTSSARRNSESSFWSGTPFGGTGSQKRAPKELEATAKRLVAERRGLSVDDLEVTNSSIAVFRHSEKEAYLFYLEDKSGNDYSVWLDKNGKEVDQEQLVRENSDARYAKYGKLSETLNDYLAKASSDEEIPVFILVEMPPDTDKPIEKHTSMSSERLKKMTDEEKRQFEQDEQEYEKQLHDYHLGRVKRYVEPVAERLKEVGSDVQTLGTSAQIYVKLKPSMIKVVEKWKEVRAINRVGTASPSWIYRVKRLAHPRRESRDRRYWRPSGTSRTRRPDLEPIRTEQSVPPWSNARRDNFLQPSQRQFCRSGRRCTNNLPPGARGIAPNVGLLAGGSSNAFWGHCYWVINHLPQQRRTHIIRCRECQPIAILIHQEIVARGPLQTYSRPFESCSYSRSFTSCCKGALAWLWGSFS